MKIKRRNPVKKKLKELRQNYPDGMISTKFLAKQLGIRVLYVNRLKQEDILTIPHIRIGVKNFYKINFELAKFIINYRNKRKSQLKGDG